MCKTTTALQILVLLTHGLEWSILCSNFSNKTREVMLQNSIQASVAEDNDTRAYKSSDIR